MELCHVISKDDWAAAMRAGEVRPASFGAEGFLHCCTKDQLVFVLQRHFYGVDGLLVLTFETADVSADVLWVRSEPDQAPFPHLHGSLPCNLVRSAELD